MRLMRWSHTCERPKTGGSEYLQAKRMVDIFYRRDEIFRSYVSMNDTGRVKRGNMIMPVCVWWVLLIATCSQLVLLSRCLPALVFRCAFFASWAAIHAHIRNHPNSKETSSPQRKSIQMHSQMLSCLKLGRCKLLVLWQTPTHLLQRTYKQIIHYLTHFCALLFQEAVAHSFNKFSNSDYTSGWKIRSEYGARLRFWLCYVAEREHFCVLKPHWIHSLNPGSCNQADFMRWILCSSLCTTHSVLPEGMEQKKRCTCTSPPLPAHFRLKGLWQWFKNTQRGRQHNPFWQDATSTVFFCSLFSFIFHCFIYSFLCFIALLLFFLLFSFLVSLDYYIFPSLSGFCFSPHTRETEEGDRKREQGRGGQQAFCWKVLQA